MTNKGIQKIDADVYLLPKLSPFWLGVVDSGTIKKCCSKPSLEPRRQFIDIDGFVRVSTSPISLNNNGNTFLINFH